MVLEFLNEPVSKFTNPKMTTVSSDLSIRDAAKVLLDSKIDSVLVFEHDQIIGIVTERDVLNDVVAKGLDPKKTTIKNNKGTTHDH